MFPFEKLDVWKKSVNFAEEILGFIDGQIHRKDAFSLGEQLRRAVISVSTNIAEGGGRNNSKEKRYFYNVAKGSVYEVVSLLELCKRRGYLGERSHRDFYLEAEELAKMLSGLISGNSLNPRNS